jgi:hypothetical protein
MRFYVRRMTKGYYDNGSDAWKPIEVSPLPPTFERGGWQAWRWARERSRDLRHENQVYQVFDGDGKERGKPYHCGDVIPRREAKPKQVEDTVLPYKVAYQTEMGGRWHQFPRKDGAWHADLMTAKAWAQARSQRMSKMKYVVTLNGEHVSPIYRNGKKIKTEVAVFELEYRAKGATAWRPFDSGIDPKVKQYSHENVVDRCRSCSFTKIHEVRIIHDGIMIYKDIPTTSELVEWITNYVNNCTAGQETNMNISKPLNIPTNTLIEKIRKYLDERLAEHDERVAKAQAKNEKRLAVFRSLFEAEPVRTVANCVYVYELAVLVADEDYTLDEAIEKLQGRPEFQEVGAYQPDKDAEKTLSVLEATSDETIEVSTESSLYRYL